VSKGVDETLGDESGFSRWRVVESGTSRDSNGKDMEQVEIRMVKIWNKYRSIYG
jgi:hypothetical protein